MKNKEFSEESSIAYFLASLNYLYDNLLLSPINLEGVSYHLVFYDGDLMRMLLNIDIFYDFSK